MPTPRTWLRAGLTVAALALLVPVAPVVLSGYLPNLPWLSNVSRLVVPWLPWLVLVAALAGVLALLALRLEHQPLQRVVAALAVLVLAGSVVMVVRVATLGIGTFASIDWPRAAGAGSHPMPTADEEVVYATVDGTPLHAQVWRAPADVANGTRPPDTGQAVGFPAVAVFVHGGSFTGGGVGGRPWLFRSWAEHGLSVVDVEYRLSPPPRWDQAPADVLCALGWVHGHAADLAGQADPKIVVIGDSAGGNLALLAGYLAGNVKSESACGTPLYRPDVVIAIEPAADLAAIWADDTVPGGGTRFPEAYVGGPPSAYPDRYAATSPFPLINPLIPPTLIVAAENDHLILPARTAALAHALAARDCRLVVVPYAEHGIAAGPDDYGEQVEEAVVPRYVNTALAQATPQALGAIGQACA